jgi:soluble lytic murein transglycosylase-like protein
VCPKSVDIVWVMAGSMELSGQQPLDLEERVRRVSSYYAIHYARLNRVPAELVEAIIEAESGWRPEAVSVKGAAGLMQLMPATAQRFQVRNRYNAEQNIRGGVEYLALLSELFEGDLRLVVAAYLAGEQRVMRRGLDYSSPQVFSYVSRVARLYRQKRQINQLTQ